ncbi:MAG: hypothetical protein HYR84_13480 [Planctomycetes bacterium]|nr:hypothetical protein [Planctomycetota bacterium]
MQDRSRTPARRWRLFAGWFVFTLAVIAPMACNSEPPLPPLHPVKGRVTFENNPVAAGNVVLHPVQAETNPRLMSGEIKATGEFEIFTGGKSGAPLGKYKVVVTPPTVPTQQTKGAAAPNFDVKYQDPKKTPLEFEVIESPAGGRYDLKLNK